MSTKTIINHFILLFLISVVSTQTINSPKTSRVYKLVTLENGVTVVLISDPNANVAAAACDIRAGSVAQPDDAPGLAYFTLFMVYEGNEKYPDPNDWENWLAANGGDDNSWVDYDDTMYYFEIPPPFLNGTLDRFANLFINPLYDPDAIPQQLQILQNAYESYRRMDLSALERLGLLAGVTPGHPLQRPLLGNASLETNIEMEGLVFADYALEFFYNYYVPSNMRCSVLGTESLDDLENMVNETLGAIPYSPSANFTWEQYYITSELPLKVISVPPTLSPASKYIRLLFDFENIQKLPQFNAYYNYSWHQADMHGIELFLLNFVGTDTEGSFLHTLEEQNYISGEITVDTWDFIENSPYFLEIIIPLTEKGMANADGVVGLFFQWINLLRDNPVKIQSLWNEYEEVSNYQFTYRDDPDPLTEVTNVAQNMWEVTSYDHVLDATFFYGTPDWGMLNFSLSCLSPTNMVYLLMGTEFINQTFLTESWYQFDYSYVPLAPELLQQWKNTSNTYSSLKLPPPNPYIAKNFNIILIPVADQTPVPMIIYEDPITTVWWKNDELFLEPKVEIYIHFDNPTTLAGPTAQVLSTLFTILVADQAENAISLAEMAGISTTITLEESGPTFYFSGYSDQILVLVEEMMGILKNFSTTPEFFQEAVTNYVDGVEEILVDIPYNTIVQVWTDLVQKGSWDLTLLETVAKQVTINQIMPLPPNSAATVFVYGNIDRQSSINIAQWIDRYLNLIPVDPEARLYSSVVSIPLGRSFRYQTIHQDPGQEQSAVIYSYQIGPSSLYNDAMAQLFALFCNPLSFSVLRELDGLAWAIETNDVQISGVTFVMLNIQSVLDPISLGYYIDEFFNDWLIPNLTNIDDPTFQFLVESAITSNLQLPTNLPDTSNTLYWPYIVNDEEIFDYSLLLNTLLNNITRQEFIDFFLNDIFNPLAIRFLRVELWSPIIAANQTYYTSNVTGPVLVTDVARFKKLLPSYGRIDLEEWLTGTADPYYPDALKYIPPVVVVPTPVSPISSPTLPPADALVGGICENSSSAGLIVAVVILAVFAFIFLMTTLFFGWKSFPDLTQKL